MNRQQRRLLERNDKDLLRDYKLQRTRDKLHEQYQKFYLDGFDEGFTKGAGHVLKIVEDMLAKVKGIGPVVGQRFQDALIAELSEYGEVRKEQAS